MASLIEIHQLSKRYRLGAIGATTLHESVSRGWTALREVASRRQGIEKAGKQDHWALRDVSFDVGAGEVVGILGRNGAGKSTLLKVLSRITEPTSGWARLRGRVGSLLEVGTGFHPDLSGRENIYLNGCILGMKKREIDSKLDAIVDFSGIEKFIDTPVKRYSSGMSVRLAFSVAAHLDPEILIIDEVLAVGDHEFQQKCLGKMGDVSRSGRTILFVSHNLAAVESLCTRSVVLSDGQVVFQGTQTEGIRHYMESVLMMRPSSEVDLPPSVKPLPMELRSLRIRNAAPGKSSDTPLETGDAVIFEVDCWINEPGNHFHVGIGLHTKHNERLLSLHTKCDPNFTWQGRTGAVTLCCRVDALPLSSGRYPLMLASASGQEVIEMHQELLVMQVMKADFFGNGGQTVGGMVNLHQKWAVQQSGTLTAA